ncbi:hypothetical protein N2152v2_003588 [Parachlorella kessleri]
MPLKEVVGSAQELRKQRAAIDAIAFDNLKLKEELMLENKFSVNPTSQSAAALIALLEEQADGLTKKITEQQRLKAELEHQIHKLQTRVAQLRAQMGGVNNAAHQTLKVQRKIRILEDRLQQCNVRYNESLTRNRELRDRIDSLRRERMLFEDIHKKLQKTLARKKQEMRDIIAIIAESHEAREKAVILQQQVKGQAEKDVANYEAEWHKLTELIEQDRKQREEQRQRDLERREKEMLALFKQEFTIPKRRSSVRAPMQQRAAEQQQPVEQPLTPVDKVKQYQQAFEKVKAATGTSTVEEVVELLVAAEEANFSLFNYVNELNGEIEKLEEQIAGVRRELDKYRDEAALKENDERNKLLKELDATLAKTEAKAEAYEEKHSQAVLSVNALRAAVWEMFNRIGCNTPAVMELLGEEGVTEKNLMQYLGIIEQRTNEILQKYFVLSTEDADAAAERATAVMTHRHAAAGSVEYMIEPPSTVSGPDAEGKGGSMLQRGAAESDHETDDDKPLDRATLEARVHKTVARKTEVAVKIRAVRPTAAGAPTGRR